MISSIVQQVCDSAGSIFNSIPVLGSVLSQLCSTLVSVLAGLGL